MKKMIILCLIFTIACKFEKHVTIEIGKKNCTKSELDAVFLDTILRKYDTCNKYKNTFYSKFYQNDKKIMEGYGKRYFKKGAWRFYNNDNDTILKTIFYNSELTGLTNFKNLDTISWGIFNRPDKGFRISKPKKWIVIENEDKTFTFNDKNGLELPNISIEIIMHLVEDIEGNIIDIFNSTIKQKRGYKSIKELKWKKLDFENFSEAYEISNIEIQGNERYFVNELLYVFKGRFYYLQFIINKKSKYDYHIIKEIIKNSFKAYDTIKSI